MEHHIAWDYESESLMKVFHSAQLDRGWIVADLTKNDKLNYCSIGKFNILMQKDNLYRYTNYRDLLDMEIASLEKSLQFIFSLMSNKIDARLHLRLKNTFDKNELEGSTILTKINIHDAMAKSLIVDLQNDYEYFFSKLSSSLRQTINLSNQHFHHSEVTNFDGFMNDMSSLHDSLSNSTYSSKTWGALKDSLRSKDAIAFQSIDGSRFIGGAVFFAGIETAHYFMGAYNRELLPLPISHGLLDLAFKTMQDRGIRYVLLDDQYSDLQYSEKQINIQRFKMRFVNTTESYPTYILKSELI